MIKNSFLFIFSVSSTNHRIEIECFWYI